MILVDPEDRWLLEEYTWHLSYDGYAVTNLPREENGYRGNVFLHHMLIGQPIWEGEEIDHINRMPWDNRRSNLRYVTRSENRINTSRKAGSSGIRNIYIRGDGRFHVRIRRDGEEYYLGAFDTLDEAVAERDEWLANNGGYLGRD